MASTRARRRLTVILHADIAGSTGLVQLDESLAHERITDAFRRLGTTVTAYGGEVHETRGDALVAEFARASDAVAASLAFQAANAAHNERLGPIAPRARVGIALGEVVVADHTVTGPGVVLAQRVEQLAAPGAVAVTAAVREATPQRLPFEYESLGTRQLKGFDEPVQSWIVALRNGSGVPPPEPGGGSVPGQRGRGPRAWAAALAVVAVIGGVAWLALERTRLDPDAPSGPPLPDKPSLAVMPFADLSNAPEQAYFADGLTDDLITDLSKVSGLFLVGRHSSFSFRGQQPRLTHVSRELGVRYVVEGSVRRDAERVRVNARLHDGTTGEQVWAERYDRDLTDLFAAQDEIVREVVAAIAVRLTRGEADRLTRRRAPVFEAYDLYLKAREGHLSRDQARMRESLALYEQAWRIDQEFARPYAGYAQLAADIWRLVAVRNSIGSGTLGRAAAQTAANRALALDPTLPDAHSVLAMLSMVDGDFEAAVASARRAVELDPNSPDAHRDLGIVLTYAGEPAAALDAMRTALRINPRPSAHLLTYYGLVLFMNRRYADAAAVLEPVADTRDRGIADSPREILAMAYAALGRHDDARAQVEALRAQEPFLNLAYYRMIYAHHARASDLEYRLRALADAGMPAWPFGFEGSPANRVTGARLRSLASDATWSGMDTGRNHAFIQEFDSRGGTVYGSATTFLSGTARVTGDEICERFESWLLGRDLCGPVFSNPDGTPEDRNEYIYVNPPNVKYFSPKR